MDLSALNPYAILVAALSNFLVGGLWYSPLLFAKRWMREIGLTEEDLRKSNMARIFGLTFVFSLILSLTLAVLRQAVGDVLGSGIGLALWLGLGLVTMSVSVTALFERRSLVYVLIHTGNIVVSYTVMSTIIALWA